VLLLSVEIRGGAPNLDMVAFLREAAQSRKTAVQGINPNRYKYVGSAKSIMLVLLALQAQVN